MKMLAGRWTVEFLSQLNFDVAFVSCAGVTLEEGPDDRAAAAGGRDQRRLGGRPAHGRVDRLDEVRAASLLTIMRADEPDLIITDPALGQTWRPPMAAGAPLEILSTGGA